MEDPSCIGSPEEENCTARPTRFIYSVTKMPVYFCEKHFQSAQAWLLGDNHGTEETAAFAEEILRINSEMGNPLRAN